MHYCLQMLLFMCIYIYIFSLLSLFLAVLLGVYIESNEKPESNSLYVYTYLASKADSDSH